MTSVRWIAPVGIELTFVQQTGRVSPCFPYTTPTLRRLKDRYNEHYDYGDPLKGVIHNDPGVVEHASPILRNWGHAEEWYDRAVSKARQVGLTSFREGCIRGGGHVHIGGLTPMQRVNCMLDVYRRPYISWACLSPWDDINGNPLASKVKYHTGLLQLHAVDDRQLRLNCYLVNGGDALTYKGSVFRWCEGLGTIEWRAFDSAADWEIQRCHLRMVQRYVQKIKQLTSRLPVPKQFCSDAWTLDQAVKGFRRFVVSHLELDWQDYEWMVERNLEVRFKEREAKRQAAFTALSSTGYLPYVNVVDDIQHGLTV